MAGEDQLDLRSTERFEEVEILLTGDAEDPRDALVLERGNEKIRTLGHAALAATTSTSSRISGHTNCGTTSSMKAGRTSPRIRLRTLA